MEEDNDPELFTYLLSDHPRYNHLHPGLCGSSHRIDTVCQNEVYTMTLSYTKVVWDIDGTCSFNPKPVKSVEDYNDPTYQVHNRLHPALWQGDLEDIKILITGRHESRRTQTVNELADNEIFPDYLVMYPDHLSQSPIKVSKWKSIHLINMQADFYVDNDPEFCSLISRHLHISPVACLCISVPTYHQMRDHGVIC